MRLAPWLRKLVLSLHIALSVGWIGAIAAYLVLDAAAAISQEPTTLRAAYVGMGLIAGGALVPLAVASLLTGVLVSVGTKWGLIRHWWVVVSLLLTVFATLVLFSEVRTIDAFASAAANPSMSSDQLRALGTTLPHSVGGSLVLLVVLTLNVYKPQGLTPYGWRRQAQDRMAARGIRQDSTGTMPRAVKMAEGGGLDTAISPPSSSSTDNPCKNRRGSTATSLNTSMRFKPRSGVVEDEPHHTKNACDG